MDSNLQVLQTLSTKAYDYLTDILGYSASVAGAYQRAWRRIFEFMLANDISDYNEAVAQQFLEQAFGKRPKKELSGHERFRFNGAKMLAQFLQTGHIDTPSTPTKPKAPPIFTGIIGEQIIPFLNYKREVQGLSKIRLRCYERTLSIFWNYCQTKDINSLKTIDLSFLLCYLKDLDDTQKTAIYTALSTLRGLMEYWYKQGLLSIDYSAKLPKYKSIQQAKLPSTYSKEEVEQLLSSVPRDSSTGKRNYAILLLAARLGLRASDIAYLKFAHLDWEQHCLSFHQIKTGRQLSLPILADVGNAIIDYLKYGRPQSSSPYVFLTA